MSRASLRDLDGISAFSVIRELYLSYNDISDVSPFAGCDTLEVLDLEGNDIDDLSSVQFLSSCNLLTSLSLESNPVAVQPEYRSTVLSWLQQLQILDDIPRGEDISQPAELRFDDGELKPLNISSPNVSLDVSIVEELELVRQGIKHGRVGLDDSTFVLYSRATTSGGLRGRPSSASLISRPTSASLSRPATAKQRPLSAEMLNQRPSTARPSTASRSSNYMSEVVVEDTSSDLTFGGEVFCGNAVGALRKRKGGMAAAEAARSASSPQKTVNPALSLFEELKKWKMETANLLINDEVVEPVSSIGHSPVCLSAPYVSFNCRWYQVVSLGDRPLMSIGCFLMTNPFVAPHRLHLLMPRNQVSQPFRLLLVMLGALLALETLAATYLVRSQLIFSCLTFQRVYSTANVIF